MPRNSKKGGGQVLLVEADAEERRSLVLMFRRTGQSVHAAGDLPSAVAAARTVQPDLTVLGTTASANGVLSACRILWQLTRRPILVVEPSGAAPGDYTVLEVGGQGAALHVLSLPQIISRAALHGGGARSPRPAERLPDLQKMGSVTLDRGGRRLLVGGKEVPLTARAFDLLSCLMASAGHVHSVESLLALVWGDRVPRPGRKTVMVHVCWLRQKLRGQDDVRIVTVHGVGYRLEAGPPPG
jgi:DNA-binding response OmpR family regulator